MKKIATTFLLTVSLGGIETAGAVYVSPPSAAERSAEETVASAALPEVGKTYYFYNKHQAGNVYFYDNNGAVGFGTAKARNKAYGWTCVANGTDKYDFVNLATGRYFAWKSLSAGAYGWTLDTTVGTVGVNGVVNEGCVTLKGVTGTSNYLVVKNANSFDQATRAGYYDATFSSDFGFEPFSLETETVDFYSSAYGEKWVRILWNKDNTDVAGFSPSSATDYRQRTTHSVDVDLTSEEQLWCLVGNATDGVKIYNRLAGETLALGVAATTDGTAARMVTAAGANKWKLVVKNGVTYAIVPASNENMSLNSYGGPNCDLKLYNANDAGSLWDVEVVTEGLRMATVVRGTNPYPDNNKWAGSLSFTIDGMTATNRVAATDTDTELRTYYLRRGADVALTQTVTHRGFRPVGFDVDGTMQETVNFTVGDGMKNITSVFEVDAGNEAQYLYLTPDAAGHPYRIPAIATARNGHVIAISDNRPCGSDIGYGEVDIKCRISKDNGRTWGREFMLADGLGVGNGQVWKTGFGDAAVVADADRNEVLVMMVCGYTVCWNGNYIPNSAASNPNRVARVRGTFNERTGEWEWTAPEEVTETIYPLFVDANDNPTVQSLFIGSGRICQSRLVKIGDYYRLYCAVWTKNQGNRVIYSDDFGDTWHVLGTIDDRPAPGGDEPKCEEMPDGSVILSSRTNGRVFNIYRYTDVKAGTGRWLGAVTSNGSNRGIAVGNSTNGEIILVDAVRQSDKAKVTLALQSVPFASSRANVGFYYKEVTESMYADVAAFASNWTKGLQVSDRGSAYSTLTLQADHRFGFFFEEEPGGYCMVYIPLTLETITGGAYALDVAALETGIGQTLADGAARGYCYDLSGRRVGSPAKGVYIIDGKKVLLR